MKNDKMFLWAMAAVVCAATQSFGSNINGGAGTMTVSPAVVSAGTTNNFEFTFRSPSSGDFDPGSGVTLRIPPGWVAPQTNDPSAGGFVSISPMTSQTAVAIRSISGNGPWKITIDITTLEAGSGFVLTYSRVATPATPRVSKFRTRSGDGNGPLTPLKAGSPTITVNDLKKTDTSTVVLTSANPCLNSQSVTFTATVHPGVGALTGTVTFRDGDIVLGSSPVQGGQANLTVDSLPGANCSHLITAEYGGNEKFNASISPALVQNVTIPQAPTLSIGTNPDGSVQLQCSGNSGQTYFIQAAANLPNGPWTTISTNVIGSNGADSFVDTAASQMPCRFYRTMISF